jgi:uncharacterized membrane protein YqjE
MSNEFKKEFSQLSVAVKDYIKTLTEIEKVNLLEKMSLLGGYLFRLGVIAFFSLLLTAFLLSALVVWYGRLGNSYLGGVLIAAGLLVLVAAACIIFRKQIVTNSVMKHLSRILFNDRENK